MARRAAEAGDLDLGPRPRSGQPVVDRLDLLEERDLVVRARQDPEAFGRLYERHRGHVYRFACSRLRNSYDAEDLTAEVFMRAWQAIERYQPNGTPFAAWLHRIASNAIVDQRRSAGASSRASTSTMTWPRPALSRNWSLGATGCAGSGSRPSSCPRGGAECSRSGSATT
jgi:Sigma-70 region 2